MAGDEFTAFNDNALVKELRSRWGTILSTGTFRLLSVAHVELDRTNPRIRRFLENYSGEPTYDQIALALDVAGGADDDASKGATTPEKLKRSILSNGGIMQPVVVNRDPEGRLVCIEGNTRLYIYRSLASEGAAGDWSQIPAIVHEGLQSHDIDAIRLQAHLVGPRPWDAYSKAKYLWELQFKELMPLDRIVDFCGGSRREVTTAIQAYADMEHYYRPICEPEEYDTERYSGFVELQSMRVKDAIQRAGFDLRDFAGWIRKGNIKNLQEVRQLWRVLPDRRAREVFIKKDVKSALDVLEKPELAAGLRNASIGQLARAVAEAARLMRSEEIRRLQEHPEDDAVRHIEEALDQLTYLHNQIQRGT